MMKYTKPGKKMEENLIQDGNIFNKHSGRVKE